MFEGKYVNITINRVFEEPQQRCGVCMNHTLIGAGADTETDYVAVALLIDDTLEIVYMTDGDSIEAIEPPRKRGPTPAPEQLKCVLVDEMRHHKKVTFCARCSREYEKNGEYDCATGEPLQ